jgi:hypothetical protein
VESRRNNELALSRIVTLIGTPDAKSDFIKDLGLAMDTKIATSVGVSSYCHQELFVQEKTGSNEQIKFTVKYKIQSLSENRSFMYSQATQNKQCRDSDAFILVDATKEQKESVAAEFPSKLIIDSEDHSSAKECLRQVTPENEFLLDCEIVGDQFQVEEPTKERKNSSCGIQ